MRSLRHAARRLRMIALLPLSMVPFALLVVLVAAPLQHGRGVRLNGGEKPWPAPSVSLSASDLATFKSVPSYRGQIPVLVYHAVGRENDYYTVSPTAFARDLMLLQHLGYHTISMRQYIAWRRGESTKLPVRPILITFDDGDFSSYRGADQILDRYHMRATIFVIVGAVQHGDPFSCSWSELQKMQRSGRWDIEFHAYRGHEEIVRDAKGDKGPYYAVREYERRLETVEEFNARVGGDIAEGLRIMAAHGFTARTMAMPFGAYGQVRAPDPAVAQDLERIIQRNFAAVFVQSGHDYTPYSRSTGLAVRYELRHSSSLAQLYRFLHDANPTVIQSERRACARGHFRVSVYEGPKCTRQKQLRTPPAQRHPRRSK